MTLRTFRRSSRWSPLARAMALLLAISLLPWYGIPTSVQAQSVPVPNLNPPAFQSTDLNPYFNAARNAGSQAGWEAIVADARTVMLASWEAAVDAQIQSAVSGVSESDAFNSTAAYQDYLRQALTLQRQEALNNWQLALEASVQLERAGFIDQLSRRTQQETSDESNRDLRNESSNPSSDADRARAEWERDFDANLEKGLADYQNALTGLFDDYNAVLLDIQQKDQEFATNKQRIDQYEQIVRDAIDQATTQLEQMLANSGMFHAETCTAQNVCTTDPNTYNADGQALSDLITQLRNGLQANARLSVLAQQITTYLQQQEQRAEQRRQYWQDRVRGNVNYDAVENTAAWRYDGVHLGGAAYDARTDVRAVQDYYSNGSTAGLRAHFGETRTIETVSTVDIVSVSPALSTNPSVINTLAQQSCTQFGHASTACFQLRTSYTDVLFWQLSLGGSAAPRVWSQQGVNMLNYVDHYQYWTTDFTCNSVATDGSIPCARNPSDPNVLSVAPPRNSTPNFFPAVSGAPCVGCTVGTILRPTQNVRVVFNYNWYDSNAEHNANTWAGYRSALTPMANSWANDILTAIRAWEDQTDAFDASYAIQQAESAVARAAAEQALATGQEALIQGRSAWLDQMQTLQRQGERRWDSLAQDDAAAASVLSAVTAELNTATPANDATAILQQNRQTSAASSPAPTGMVPPTVDFTRLDALAGNIEKTFTGIQNLALASTLDSQATATEQRTVQNFAAAIQSASSGIDGDSNFRTEITADGRIVARRDIHEGVAIQNAGTDGTSIDHYTAARRTQTLQFQSAASLRLASTGDLFSAWNYEDVLSEQEKNQAAYDADLEKRFEALNNQILSANSEAVERYKAFQSSAEKQIEHNEFVKSIIESAAQAMLGGASLGEAFKSAIQGKLRGQVAGVFAEATGLPAGFISALLGGAKPDKAFMSYVEGEMWSTFETEMSKATGLPLNGVLSSLWQKREQKKQEAKQKKAAVVDTVMTVAAVVAAPFTGGASVAALAAVKAAQGAQKGGLKGAIAGAASAYANAAVQTASGGTVSVDLSYSYENGFGAGVGFGVGPAKIGISASERGGASISAGIGDVGGGTLGINMKYSKNGGFSAGVGYTNTASGVALGANYSPGAGLSGYASITTDRGGTAGAGSTSVGVGFSRSEGAGAFVQRGNAETGQGKVSFTQRDGLGVSVKNSFAEIGTSQRGGTTYAVNLKTGDGFGEAGVLPGANLGLKYNTNTGFSASLTGNSAFGGYGVNYSDEGGLSSSLDTSSGVHNTGGPQITSLDDLSSAASRITSERQATLERESMLADVRRSLAERGVGLSNEQLAYLRQHPEQLAEIMHDAGILETAAGNETRTAGAGSTRDTLWERMTGPVEDAYRGIVQGTISNDRGYIDPVTGEYRERTCFVQGTLVLVSPRTDGAFEKNGLWYKKIETIQVGDEVVSFEAKSRAVVLRPVTATFVRTTHRLFELDYVDGNQITTTWNHPFYVEAGKWNTAVRLRPRDRMHSIGSVAALQRESSLASLGQGLAAIVARRSNQNELSELQRSTIRFAPATPVYNIEVSGTHTYFVGLNGLLVHNYNILTGEVEAGDSLWTIQQDLKRRFGKVYSTAEIAAMNGISRDRPLRPGQRLFAPENFRAASDRDRDAFFTEGPTEAQYESISLDANIGLGFLVESGYGLFTSTQSRGIYSRVDRGFFSVSPNENFVGQFTTGAADFAFTHAIVSGATADQYWGLTNDTFITRTGCVSLACAGVINRGPVTGGGSPVFDSGPVVGRTMALTAGVTTLAGGYSRAINTNSNVKALLTGFDYRVRGTVVKNVIYEGIWK